MSITSRHHIIQLARAAADTSPPGTNPVVVSPWPQDHPAYPIFEREFTHAHNNQIEELAE
jgi:hypothetical protein